MAERRTDFMLDEDGDFPLEDTYIGGKLQDTPLCYSDQQHIKDLIEYSPGDLIFSPLTGFSIKSKLNGEFKLNELSKSLKNIMNLDGYKILTGVLSPVFGGFKITTSFIVRK